MRLLSTTALAALAATGLATAADARRVAVDEGISATLGGCTLDWDSRVEALCQPVDLGFTIAVRTFIDEEIGDVFDYYSSVVLYDDGFIGFGGEHDGPVPNLITDFFVPVVAAQYDLQDFQPLGQFVSDASEVIRGPGTFEAFWYNANIFWTCTEFDEENEFLCLDGFITTIKQPPHARMLIESLPGDRTRFTLSWTQGAINFGYALGSDVRELGGSGERFFQFVIGPPIPEPGTWAMMIAGFGLVGVAARQRRRLSAA